MDSRIIVALDFANRDAALDLAKQLYLPDQPRSEQCKLKVGKELFTRAGPEVVSSLVDMGFEVFLDLKFHDIPNTVAKACQAASELGVWMLNVHASGGRKMMLAAREAIDQQCSSAEAKKPLLIAVTVLTSMAADDLTDVGIHSSPEDQVKRLADLTQQCGLDGVVCSPLEIETLREQIGRSFKLVTPGVRPQGASLDDQQRVMTPELAVTAGADYLVIGRPICQAPNPVDALRQINESISALT